MKKPQIKLFTEVSDQYYALHEGVRPVFPDDATPPGSTCHRNLPVLLAKDFAKHCDYVERALETTHEWAKSSKLWQALYKHVSKAKEGKCAIDISSADGRSIYPYLKKASIWKDYSKKNTEDRTEVKLFLRMEISLHNVDKYDTILFPYEMFTNFNQETFNGWCKVRAKRIKEDAQRTKAYRQLEAILLSGVLSPSSIIELAKDHQQRNQEE